MRRLLALALVLASATATSCADLGSSLDELNATAPGATAPPATVAPSPPAAPAKGLLCLSVGFGGVRPHVARVGHHIQDRFGVGTVYGVEPGTVTGSDHPLGLALDFMVFSDRALGDQVAAYAIAHWAEFGIKYVIWRQRIHEGRGWSGMPDRGGVTANHYDHVHISFRGGLSLPSLTC